MSEEATPQEGQTDEATVNEEPQVPEGFVPQDSHQKQVNKQHKKFRDEERAHADTKAEADRLRRELNELKAKSEEVTIPAIPDPLDDNYQDKVRARDEAIQQKTRQDAEREALEHREKELADRAQEQQQERDRQRIESFDARMVELGVNPIEVKQAADTLMNYGVNDTLGDFILDDEEGPLIAQYLASNPIEFDEVNRLSVSQLFTRLPDIKAKAAALRPQTSKAPDPPDTLRGGGVSDETDPLLRGAKFE